MPRGRKKQEVLSLDAQLEAVTKEIAECEENLKKLKEQKKTLTKQIAEDQKEKMYQAVLASGKSIDEILASLS